MEAADPQYVFKETRLSLEVQSAASVVSIRVPSKTARENSRRRYLHRSGSDDETTFRNKNIATSSSIFSREWHDAPSSFLWRVLEDNTVLSIRVVDVCRNDKTLDHPLVLNFTFTVPILTGCVAFADPREHDALCLFVLDEAAQLYTFTLRPDVFRRRAAVDTGLSELGKVQFLTCFNIRTPYRMFAVTASRLLVTTTDGSMMRLDKIHHDDSPGGLWKDTIFNAQGWAQNLRNLLPFHGKHVVRKGKISLEHHAATSIHITSLGLKDSCFAVTICLDHRMRIWNIEEGQILFQGDILGKDRAPQEIGKWTLDPSYTRLVQISGTRRGQRICATYSPLGSGEFKFWKIVAKDAHTLLVNDLFPQATLLPQPPSVDIWTLADFVLASPAEGALSIWTLWKNNMTYRVQRLEIDRQNMLLTWEGTWDAVFSESTSLPPQVSGSCDSTDVSEKWLQFLLEPGRFSKATLQSALSIYQKGLGTDKENAKGRGLAESLCSTLGTTASLERTSSGAMDYEQFRAATETQWRRFYRLAIELDRQRGEAISLVLDSESGIAWVVCADLLSAITECGTLERLYFNLSTPEDEQEDLATFLGAALSFVDNIPDNYILRCNAVLRSELFEDHSTTDLERIQHFSDEAAFWRGLTDEDCAQVIDTLGRNFATVADKLYRSVLDLIAAPREAKRRPLRRPLTEFGKSLLVKGILESVDLQWKVYFAQLILLVHMEFEFDVEEEALHHRVDVGTVFRELISALRRIELLRWLVRTELSGPIAKREKESSPKPTKYGQGDAQSITALEACVGHLLGFGSRSESLSVSITELISNLCAPDSDIEVSPTLLQCALLKRERPDLAQDLAPFCEQDPFPTYVKGRVLLALRNLQSAAVHFGKAAIGLGTENLPLERHSCGLLDETEWNHFNGGQDKYYSHIIALFEEQRAYSYVVEFSRLALQFLGPPSEGKLTKTDVLSRLFHAALAVSHFERAYASLYSMSDEVLRQASLRKLIEKMCEMRHNTELVSFPFSGMQQEVEAVLVQRCRYVMDVAHGSPYHQALYAWRMQRNNFRGAASVIMDQIHKLRKASCGDEQMGEDVLDTLVTRQYLLLINALCCVDATQAWIFEEGIGEETKKRRVLSLADIRKQYQDELDRITAIQNNQFAFEADVMEIA